jgi:hypothetical protein
MPRRSHRVATLVASLSLVAALGVAGPAAAKGGSSPAPAPAPAPLDCFGDPAILAMTTPDVAVNYAGSAGCVGVRSVSSTQLRLAWVVLAPNWTYVVKSNGEGTNSRVQLQFTNSVTGDKLDFRYEFGKTVIG